MKTFSIPCEKGKTVRVRQVWTSPSGQLFVHRPWDQNGEEMKGFYAGWKISHALTGLALGQTFDKRSQAEAFALFIDSAPWNDCVPGEHGATWTNDSSKTTCMELYRVAVARRDMGTLAR